MPTERYSVVSSILLVAQAARFSALPESVRSKRRSQRVYFSMQQSVYNADLSVAERLYGRLNVTTPEIYVHGMLDGWLYLVMSRISGVYLSVIWNTLDDESRLRIVIELGEVVAQLHTVPTDNLPQLAADCGQAHRDLCAAPSRASGTRLLARTDFWLSCVCRAPLSSRFFTCDCQRRHPPVSSTCLAGK